MTTTRSTGVASERKTPITPIPIIELWGNLVVPLQGEIRDSQLEELRGRLLTRIRERNADGVVLDASGVWLLDSHLCAVLGRIAGAARLMGAHPVLCGLSPDVVMTLMHMGIDLAGIDTALGLEEALEALGLRVVRDDDDDDRDEDTGRDDEDDDQREVE